MRISQLFAAERPVFSFEFVPPKTDAGYSGNFVCLSIISIFDP
jgi:hypothetical protein